ncbi:MAG: T9SS type A sorting domain-containing protein [Flavobacterium sp.]|nr:T9SS type A sorting domain-containing protein [Flavobacterium sp.]
MKTQKMKNTTTILVLFIMFKGMAQNVNIPDVNFKAYLVGNPSINTNGDAEIQVTEATAFTGHINCPNLGISSLVGIEEFTNFTQLSAWSNQITFANLSANTSLNFIRLENNLLTNLILNRTNSVLDYLNLTINQLTSFNASEHPLLETFLIRFNQLSSIDVTQNPLLRYFGCGSNLLTSVNVTQNPELEYLFCDNNQISSLNLSQNPDLYYLSCTSNQLTTLDFSMNPLLNEVVCWNNQLTSINTTQNTVLTKINCDTNQLTSVDFSQNTALIELFCAVNQITTLDVTSNTALTMFGCYNNQLTSLNVQNGANTNLTYYNSDFNPNLSCILVDDATYSSANWLGVDPASTFANNIAGCNTLSTNSIELETLFKIIATENTIKILTNYEIQLKTYEVYALTGAKVGSGTTTEISINTLAKGIYILKLDFDKGTVIKKFIK